MIYETLIEKDQAKINAIVSSVKEHLSIDGELDVDLLMATLERLNDAKREAREDEKKRQAEIANQARLAAADVGKRYVQTLKEGDLITFIYGPAGYTKQATLPIDKIGLSTVQVTYTDEMVGPNSKTKKRNIRYDKIVVPEEFAATAA